MRGEKWLKDVLTLHPIVEKRVIPSDERNMACALSKKPKLGMGQDVDDNSKDTDSEKPEVMTENESLKNQSSDDSLYDNLLYGLGEQTVNGYKVQPEEDDTPLPSVAQTGSPIPYPNFFESFNNFVEVKGNVNDSCFDNNSLADENITAVSAV